MCLGDQISLEEEQNMAKVCRRRALCPHIRRVSGAEVPKGRGGQENEDPE
jgi:hypothetical protein